MSAPCYALYHGDTFIDLIVTDPPYLISGFHKSSGILDKGQRSYANEILNEGIYKGFDLSILEDFVRVMKKINIYLWCNKEQIYDYLTFFVKERKCIWEMIVWAKNNPAPFLNGHYLKDKEYCLYFWEQGVKVKPTFDTGRTVYLTNTNTGDKDNYLHPTIKPIEIISNLIKNSSGGGIVLDPFAGSGTTCLAAKRLGLQYIGFEINPKYHKIAVDRLNGFNQRGYMNLLDIDDND